MIKSARVGICKGPDSSLALLLFFCVGAGVFRFRPCIACDAHRCSGWTNLFTFFLPRQ